MLIAGLSELLLIAGLSFAFVHNLKHKRSLIIAMAIIITTCAASAGFIRYLELADTVSVHQSFSFISKHFAMPAFITGLLWQSFSRPVLPWAILGLTLISFAINTLYSAGFISDAIIVLLCLYFIYQVRTQLPALAQAVTALFILTSTLIWGIIMSDKDLLLGLFHLSLACFFVLMARSSEALIPLTDDNKHAPVT